MMILMMLVKTMGMVPMHLADHAIVGIKRVAGCSRLHRFEIHSTDLSFREEPADNDSNWDKFVVGSVKDPTTIMNNQ